ncbi:HAD-IB family hydrolase [Kitasatospora sp. NPDC002551]|uniref:HAD family hydrolase n=1 Tax=unclassified Kitasatospora TaxID=2633591 RepID=UPI00332B6E6A
MSGPGPAPVAFFDVDETLLAVKGMAAFREHWDASRAHARTSERPADLDYTAPGVPREELNRRYYRGFAGVPAAALRPAVRAWYADYRRGPQAFVAPALAALARHRALGHAVVLVSGSLRPLLEAVAEDLGADEVRCTEQSVSPGGLLTGEVDRPMIGPAKAEAVASVLRGRGARAADCFAYGDHGSDLAMLRAVGHPVVVNGSPDLLAEAARVGWAVLGGRRGPRNAGAVTAGHRSDPV